MQISNSVIINTLDGGPGLFQHDTGSLMIQQYATCIANQPQGPPCHQNGTDDAHCRVHPVQPYELSCKQGENCQERCKCICQDMEIGSPEVVIRMPMAVMVWICMVVVMMMTA